MVATALIGLFVFITPAWAQSAADIAAEIRDTGRYLEFDESGVGDAVDQANANGIAFVWLDQSQGEGSAQALAGSVLTELDGQGSRYRTVLVLMNDNYGAMSDGVPQSTMDRALNEARAGFSAGAVAAGLGSFDRTIAGDMATTATTSSSSSSSSESTSPSGSSGGIGLGSILLPLALLVGGFWLFRNWGNKRKADKEAAAELAADRAEIHEQLRNNADNVINLGDRVVTSGDNELMSTYEKASAAYQEVSRRIEGAETVEEVDELDDMIDQAEWEFDMIEAKLDGRPVPPSPAEVERAEAEAAEAEAKAKRAENDRPALGPDESVVSGGRYPGSSARTGGGGYGRARRAPRGRYGGMGGGLGGMLGSIILGGMRGGGRGYGYPRTRRSRRRGGSIGGGLGGGVLRPGGSSRRSGGGRSLGSGRSGGGRSL